MHLNNREKILIIRLSSLGDILLTTPIIRTLKNTYPASKINFLLKQKYNDVLVKNPNLSKIFLYKSEKDGFEQLLKAMNQEKFDFVIDLQNNLRSYKIRQNLKVPGVKFHKNSSKNFLYEFTPIPQQK